MSEQVKKSSLQIEEVFNAVEEILSEYKGEANLQFPLLALQVATKLNWSPSQMKDNDCFIRWYVRNHPNWVVTTGAKGGIMPLEKKQQKLAEQIARSKAKESVKMEIAKKLNKLAISSDHQLPSDDDNED